MSKTREEINEYRRLYTSVHQDKIKAQKQRYYDKGIGEQLEELAQIGSTALDSMRALTLNHDGKTSRFTMADIYTSSDVLDSLRAHGFIETGFSDYATGRTAVKFADKWMKGIKRKKERLK